MEFKDRSVWLAHVVSANRPFHKNIMAFAEEWADRMEQELENGETVAAIAERTSHEADLIGVTHAQFGAAVKLLGACWLHGDALMAWDDSQRQ